ncbi:MAG TPA: DUF389 domain-containing protein [Novosphingobium sp.]|nr:DUF389 domain-containing protein [Novosphingobium sp.]HQA17843.1 DUF389 domain-containing protein [Novosphingobium sp.]
MSNILTSLVPQDRLDRIKDRLLRWRLRAARFLMLPQLSADEAREMRQAVQTEGELTQGFVLMSALSAGIATFGLLQSSTAVVIGAMLISPLMGPIAALGFGFASLDGRRIRDALRVVLIGAAIGILTGVLLTWLSPIRNATPEILARTQPTLLDFAVALLSGLAGGYATVIGKGGTAIGVAIATALMPPLATLGYGLGVLQPTFALGALLLFLTNLSAIAFSFALVARLSGAARPWGNVEWEPRYIAAGIAAFLALAVPLGLTLLRVVEENALRGAARTAIIAEAGKGSTIAQLDVNWSLLEDPRVSAVVVTPHYTGQAGEKVRAALSAQTGEPVEVNLQQVLSADIGGQTQTMIDAAMERTVAGIAADVPPMATIRGSLGLPSRSMWINRAERTVFVEPVAAPGWTLADYRQAEERAAAGSDRWIVRVVPPASADLRVAVDQSRADATAVSPDLAAWAIARWGLAQVTVRTADGTDTARLAAALTREGVTMVPGPVIDLPAGLAQITVLGAPPQR